MITSSKSELTSTIALLLLLGVCVWLYYPGLSGPVLLDDASNIEQSFGAEVSGFANEESYRPGFWEYVSNNNAGPLGRPVSMATFYAEYWFCPPRSFVGKSINLALHCVVGLLLYMLVRRTLRMVGLDSSAAALFATAFWLLAPLHVSTVLYHVQRMAILAALFSLLFIHGWFSLRGAYIDRRSLRWPAIGTLLSGILAIGAKENAVVVLPLVLLFDWFFLGERGEPNLRQVRWRRTSKLALAILALLGVVACLLASEWIVRGYEVRQFTLGQRLLTESRILWSYAYEFFLPNIQTLGLSHDDYPLSRGLFDPISTLWAVTAMSLGALTLLAFWSRKVFRYIAFGVVFFFTAHALESSLLALELYFEHRNYFPSVGFAVSLGIIGAYLGSKYPQTSRSLMVAITIWLVVLAADLSSQSAIWGDRTAIVLTERAGHPESSRANIAMAVLTASAGDTVSAERFSKLAAKYSDSETDSDHIVRFIALSCLANKPVPAGWYPAQLTQKLGSSSGRTSLEKIVVAAETDRCPEFDFEELADFFSRAWRSPDFESGFDRNVMVAALRIERVLGRQEPVSRYEEILQQVLPD
ncbi:hypothetical protein R0137_07415 [Congregibacter brevis]|uniref:Glycosyltransferase RgtA/B/C/D-like domain-containing protein n=1 Tax=Congregibacter brevis TaxID=3081201 RepID=A0ABZ0IIQ7_9GAMM|nr:hypothetical protein R0137_07415 [Congregibacter sp. IMCC45268]